MSVMKQGGSQASLKFKKGSRATNRPGEKQATCCGWRGGDGEVAGRWICLCRL